MNEFIIKLLDDYFYYSATDDCIYCIDNDEVSIGYSSLHNFIRSSFDMGDDRSYGLVFNWLVDKDVPLIRHNWNKQFIRHKLSLDSNYNQSKTEDIDFKYVLVDGWE